MDITTTHTASMPTPTLTAGRHIGKQTGASSRGSFKARHQFGQHAFALRAVWVAQHEFCQTAHKFSFRRQQRILTCHTQPGDTVVKTAQLLRENGDFSCSKGLLTLKARFPVDKAIFIGVFGVSH